MSKFETVGERLTFLLPTTSTRKTCPRWPPDVFCICAALLQRSGAYSQVATDAPPHKIRCTGPTRAKQIAEIGKAWRKTAVRPSDPLPKEVIDWWQTLISFSNIAVTEIRNQIRCCEALINLLAAADEASHSLGILSPSLLSDLRSADDAFLGKAEKLLARGLVSGAGSTLCKDIHPSRGRVLPKMHTSQSGLTIRSFSHHLCYYSSPDLVPMWWSGASEDGDHPINLLVVPWPPTVDPVRFKRTAYSNIRENARAHGLFTFEILKGPGTAFVKALIKKAEQKIGPVNGVIFPELSMSQEDFDRLAEAVVDEDRFLIAGVGEMAQSSKKCGRNEALWELQCKLKDFDPAIRCRFAQAKHHRWKLTKAQIQQYGLSSTLNLDADWWEHIGLRRRGVGFTTLRSWLSMTLLICEDLARPDPVGDLIRAVGPNLIVALLCDGPQIQGRWPGRYAGALADDPGSSVLTITSEGMSNLARPLHGDVNRSRIVALWRDALNGTTEIELTAGASGLLLTLSVQYAEEWTADGRGDGGSAGYPILSGIHPISVGKGRISK